MRCGSRDSSPSKPDSRRPLLGRFIALAAAMVLVSGLLSLPVATMASQAQSFAPSVSHFHSPAGKARSSSGDGCPSGSWPTQVTGVPNVNPGMNQGFYIGVNANGLFSLVSTHPKSTPRVYYHFSGTVTTDGSFDDVSAIQLEKGDTYSVSADTHTLTFDFNNGGDLDGLSFLPMCGSTITFGLAIKGASAPTSRINVGMPSTNPSSDPFTFTRNSQICGSQQVQSSGPVTATLTDTATTGTDCKDYSGFTSTGGADGQDQTLSFNAATSAGNIPLTITIPWAPETECQPSEPTASDPLPECAPTQVSLDGVTFTDQTFCASASPGTLCTTNKSYNYVLVDGVTETQITETWVGDVDCCYWAR
jgi:hypothetical protein